MCFKALKCIALARVKEYQKKVTQLHKLLKPALVLGFRRITLVTQTYTSYTGW